MLQKLRNFLAVKKQMVKEMIAISKKECQEYEKALAEEEKELKSLEKALRDCREQLDFLNKSLAISKRKFRLTLVGEALRASNQGKPATYAWSFRNLVAAKKEGKSLLEIAFGLSEEIASTKFI